MLLFVLAYLGGVLTIVSPCILPVLPFVFARADRSFVRSGLPLLAGMALTFAAVATLAAAGGGWAVEANQYGRDVAMVLLALVGVVLLFPSLSDRATQPLVALGARLSRPADRGSSDDGAGVGRSVVLGIATGLLWAPCAGPVLGLVLTGAALQGANLRTSFLLLAYAAGAATSLACALLVGGRVLVVMKRSLGAGVWIRRGLGAAVLLGVAAIALGLDTGVLARLSLAGTSGLEARLIDRLHARRDASGVASSSARAASDEPPTSSLPVEGTLPSLSGAVAWLNSPPLTADGLKGHVVVVDFWTYSCINCLRSIPYVVAWSEKYRADGLVVIGVHAPEFAFEKDIANVKRAVASLQIPYPVAVDNNYAIWRAFSNEYWPAHYFVDALGRIRHHHFGEGEYDESEHVIQQLLAEAGHASPSSNLVAVTANGSEAAPDLTDVRSEETYIGYDRAERFVSRGGAVDDAAHSYAIPSSLSVNEWALAGTWTMGAENAALNTADGAIAYRFHARDLHLVLGPGPDGRPVRFVVTLDGAAPGGSHGSDVDTEGRGTVTEQRLYQLIRQSAPIVDHTFEIRFLDRGVHAYAFTFG